MLLTFQVLFFLVEGRGTRGGSRDQSRAKGTFRKEMLFRAKETFRKEMLFVLSGQQFSPSSLVKFLGALAHAGGGAAEAPGATELKRCPAYLELDRPGRVLALVPTLGTPTP